jgi:hypothetical protein
VADLLPNGEACAKYNTDMLAKLVSIAPATIIIAANYNVWSKEKPEQYWQGLRNSLAALSGAGHRLILLGQIPHLPNHMPAPATVARWSSQGNDPADFKFSPDERFPDLDANLRILASEVSATYVPVAPALCKDGRCSAYLEGAVLYFDDNHLSVRGADLLAKKLLVPILWPETKAPIVAGAQSQP